jgi:asparagine N-glycosylation enzyme membrane subunit Stt3
MGGWYWIGVCVGLGTAAGVLLAGVLSGVFGAARAALFAAATLAGVAGAAIGFGIDSAELGGIADVVGGIVGAVVGTLGATQVVTGALRRGGTRGGVAALVAGAAIALGALALVPVVGYLEALALPTLGARLRRRMPDKHEGLRTLARD